MNLKDGRVYIDVTDDIDTTLSKDQKAAARRIVADHAQGDTHEEQVADAVNLMLYLGIHPTQEEDHLLVGGPLYVAGGRLS